MNQKPSDPERWKNLVVFLALATTLVAAVVAALQADANIRAGQANRDSQIGAIQVQAELQRSGLQANYELGTLAAVLKDLNETTKLQLVAAELQNKGDKAKAALVQAQADAALARANQAKVFSVLYSDPRYAPSTSAGVPNTDRYIADANAQARARLAQQDEATNAYQKWSTKSDAYVVALIILIIALFLLSLAQALTPRLRLLFAMFGVMAAGLAGLWVVIILLS